MEKLYSKLAFVYAIAAMIFGVFYREFTKLNHYTEKTNLSVIHTHYFMLGMFFFLILMLLEKNFSLSDQKNIKRDIITYQIGLNITGLTLFVRGLMQIINPNLSRALNASISGIAGIGHILLGLSLIFILLKLRKSLN